MAAGGYPDSYHKGDVINGIDQVTEALVFHAGTAQNSGQVVTNGGRVLCVTALGDTVAEAQQKAYSGVDKIRWNNRYFRTDIGHRAITREKV